MSVGKVRQGQAQASGCWIRRERRLALYIRHQFRCCYCGTDLRTSEPSELTLDHLLPRSLGGDNSNDNLVLACRSCNSARGAKPWVDYAVGGAIDRINQERHELVNVALAKSIISGDQAVLVADVEATR